MLTRCTEHLHPLYRLVVKSRETGEGLHETELVYSGELCADVGRKDAVREFDAERVKDTRQ